MAVPAEKGPKKQNLPSIPEAKLTPVQAMAAQLIGRGYSTGYVAGRLVDYIITKSTKPLSSRKKQARARIRAWSKTQEFRDMVYETAVVRLDLETPLILQGIGRKARAGRVDAAKLALEVTGRHNPKGDDTYTHVSVEFNGIPRPQREHRGDHEIGSGEVEDAEWEEA